MSYIIWILFITLGIVKPYSKTVNAVQKTWVVTMWGMANDIADISEYRMHFINSPLNLTPRYLLLQEGLYRNTCWLFRKAGLSFDVYLIILALFCVIVIDHAMDYFEIWNKGLVWSALMIFPMHELNVTLQGRLAFCVVMLGLKFLNEFSVGKAIKYGIMVIIAGCIHTGAYEYVILYVVYILIKGKKTIVEIFGLMAVECIMIDTIKKIILSFNVDGWRLIDVYFENVTGWGKTIGHILIYLIVIVIATYGYKKNDSNKKMESLRKVMWAMMLGYPLVYLSTQLRRNLELMFIIPYMCIAYNITNLESNENKRVMKFITLFMAMVVFWGLHVRDLGQFQENYVRYVIKGNYISQGRELVIHLLIISVIFVAIYCMSLLKFRMPICRRIKIKRTGKKNAFFHNRASI